MLFVFVLAAIAYYVFQRYGIIITVDNALIFMALLSLGTLVEIHSELRTIRKALEARREEEER